MIRGGTSGTALSPCVDGALPCSTLAQNIAVARFGCAGRAEVGLLRTGGDEDCGEGLEVFDELVELVRVEGVVGRGRRARR
jgi:hypothetical protein